MFLWLKTLYRKRAVTWPFIFYTIIWTLSTTLWTGEKLQLTVMEIPVGGDIGLEVHNENDQFIRIEQGDGLCQMGPSEDNLSFEQKVSEDEAVFVPLGVWHNITNKGNVPLKLYTIYASPDHVPGTVHSTQEDAEDDPNE